MPDRLRYLCIKHYFHSRGTRFDMKPAFKKVRMSEIHNTFIISITKYAQHA